MEKILRQAARYNLIRFQQADNFEDSAMEVLPAIRRIVPFRELAEWTETANAFRQTPGDALAETDNGEDEP